MKKKLILNGSDLRLGDIRRVIHSTDLQIEISEDAMDAVGRSRRVIEKAIARGDTIYGVNTGFGKLASVRIPDDQLVSLQRNLILSHSAAVGEPLSLEVCKIVLVLRINSLVKGYSGVRPELIATLVTMFNNKVIPMLPSQGSVGASGDLAPLSHLALVVMGLGDAYCNGHKMSGAIAMRKTRTKPLKLESKEGLALINGTQIMTAATAWALIAALDLVKHCDITAAMSLEALQGTNTAFDYRIQQVRPHPHQEITAANLRKLTANSWLMASHVDCGKVQDPYSLRCVPQVHGASRSAFAHVRDCLKTEFNSATDNPLIFVNEQEILSGGNFHGQPIAMAADYLGIAIAELASIAERRIENLVNPELSGGLPAFLAYSEGLDSGYMAAQITAASLVSENKVFCHPACVDSIPTSGNKEDHVSMGATSAMKSIKILENAEYVVGIEMMCAAQGLDYMKEQPGVGVETACQAFRRTVPPLKADRLLSKDVESARKLIRSGKILRAVERKVGELG